MSVQVSYPGIYVKELESSIKTIVGVSTSITAFIGEAKMGPLNKPTTVYSFEEYTRVFGGLWEDSSMSFSVYHFFLNGGGHAIIVRIVNSNADPSDGAYPVKASIVVGEGTTDVINLEAENPGSWGNALSITVDHDLDAEMVTADPTLFNLQIDHTDGLQEVFQNLSLTPTSPRYVISVLESQSDLVRVAGTITGGKPAARKYPVDS